MEIENKKKTSSGNWYRWFVIICSACMIAGVILCSVCLIASIVMPPILQEKFPGIQWPVVTAEDIIKVSTVDILSIFATVVAASYLANVINKKDIDDLKKDIDEQKSAVKDVSELKQDVARLRPVVENNQDILFNLFIETIDQPNADIFSHLLADAFRNSYQSQNAANGTEVNYNLIEIEHFYYQVHTRHHSAYKVDESLLGFAEKAEETIKTLLEKYSGTTDWDKLVGAYLKNRLAGFKFYCGYCTHKKEDGIRLFIEAAELILTCKENDTVLTITGNERYRLAAFYENMIGECYSKVVQYYTDSFSDTQKLESMNSLEVMFDGKIHLLGNCIESISKCGIEHCSNATSKFEKLEDSATDNDRAAASVYYRDRGCAQERNDRLNVKPVKESRCLLKKFKQSAGVNNYSGYNDIVDSYTKSLQMLCGNTRIDSKSATNSYYTLLSYYKKYWDANCGFECTCYAGMDKEMADRIQMLSENMYRIGKLAIAEFPRNGSFLYFYGFSCAFAAALIKNDFKLNLPYTAARYYIEQVEEVCKTGELLDPNNGIRKSLTTALGKIQKM